MRITLRGKSAEFSLNSFIFQVMLRKGVNREIVEGVLSFASVL